MTVARESAATGAPHTTAGQPDTAENRPAVTRFTPLTFICVGVAMAGGLALGLPIAAVLAAASALILALVGAAVALSRHHPFARLGGANVVTLIRLTVVAFLLAVLFAGGGHPVAVIAVSVVALSLDGVDGYLARRQGLSSRFGASFDMEVDSAFALVLALLAGLGPAGPLAILLGLPRYLFGAAALAYPWLNGPIRPRYSRKVICVLQLIALIALQFPFLSAPVAIAIVIVTAGLLAWSFGVDILELRRNADDSGRPALIRLGQALLTALILAVVWQVAGGVDVLDILFTANPWWLLAACVLLVTHTVLSALRWRVTAAPLGIDLSGGHAIREYFLAQLVNTTLPGGVVGDAARAARTRHQATLGRSVGAVVVERGVGQVALLAVFAVAFLATLFAPGGIAWPPVLVAGISVALLALAIAGLVLVLRLRFAPPAPGSRLGRLVDGTRRSLTAPGVLPAQLVLSAGATVCILAAFACCAAAVGAPLPLGAVFAVVPLVLFAMVLPISVGGWGVREGAAVALLPIAGLTTAQAFAASAAFGVMALVASLPGLALVWTRRRTLETTT
ncbi:lysylphosphatidylglycerol synthase domain-containing protein [Microbacterium sp. CCNWLW134]|uniref:lysylphosphatidylglycerol synthase domain-containing protein n=1 Tax=Microbacterium sp. CCNWLW134 TaxID=3122064 RepID=UPI00300FFEC6